MASTDATFVPVKNQAYRVTFPILDADGDPVAGATSLDSEVSKDGGTFADCTNEATQIATSSGMYFLDLTSTEMNADTVAIIVKSAEGKTVPIVLYPQESGSELKADVTHFGGTAGTFASGRPEVNVSHWKGQAAATVDTNGYPVVTIKNGSGAGELSITAGGVSISAANINAIADQVWDEAASGHVAAGSYGAWAFTIRSATAQAGSGTTITLDASASAVNDFYKDQFIHIVSGTGVGQGRIVTSYVGATKVATVSSWATNPDNTSVFVVRPFGAIPGASAPTAAQNAAAVWDELQAGHTTANSYGLILQAVRNATAQAGSSASITLDASASATDDLYRYQTIRILSGTGAGQARQITAYVGSTKVASVAPNWAVNPSSDSVFVIKDLGIDAATVATIADAVWDEARAGHVAAGSFGEYVLSDAIRFSGNSTAADNAELAFTGGPITLTGVTIPTVTSVGSVSGAVASVTGSVGSVTGNVGGNVVGSVASVAGNVTGSVGSVTGAVGSVTGNVGGNVTGSVGSLAAQAKADVNAEVLDVVNVDTYAEPGQILPAATASLAVKINFLYKAWRNRSTQTAAQYRLYADDSTTIDQKATFADDTTTADRGEIAAGP